MSSDNGQPIVVIGQRGQDGHVRLEGRDWHMVYRQGRGDPSPWEMALKVEWLVMRHAQMRMERAASEARERRRESEAKRQEDLIDALLEHIASEQAGEGVPY